MLALMMHLNAVAAGCGLPHRADIASASAFWSLDWTVKLPKDAGRSTAMELTDTEIHLLTRLSQDRRLYAECKGADLDALEKVGLLQWFDARGSTTPFNEDPRPLFRLLLFSGRIDYFWVAPVENWRELVGPEVSAKVDGINEIEQAVTGRSSISGQLAADEQRRRGSRDERSKWRAIDAAAGQQIGDLTRPV
jgi:hypothetical protein